MDQIYYRPDIELRTIVGTPMALETALTKLRGPVGDEVVGKLDYTQMKGGFDFDYAVYDEVCTICFCFFLFSNFFGFMFRGIYHQGGQAEAVYFCVFCVLRRLLRARAFLVTKRDVAVALASLQIPCRA